MKIRFMCTKHECDLLLDSVTDALYSERLSDVDNNIKPYSEEDKSSGYYMFNFDSAWCPEDKGNVLIDHTIASYTPSTCNDSWKAVLYS